MTVKIKDVAKAASVSVATVSYVLNNSAPVSEETRIRVLNAVKELGYRPNSTARNLKASESRLIGYAWHNVLPGQMNPILDRFIFHLSRAAEARRYHILTFTEDLHDPRRAYEELIHTSRVDGFVLAGTDYDDPRIRSLLDHRFPFVAFGRANPDWDFPFADVDVYAGVQATVAHLVGQGHRRIGCVAWPNGSRNGDIRLSGFLDAIEQAGIDTRPAWIVRARNTIRDGATATAQLLNQSAADRPTAIMAISDVLAIGVMYHLESIGLRIGIDVAVTGFDDDPVSAFLRPALTTVHQPIDLIAAHTLDLLAAVLSNQPIAQRQTLFMPDLVIRASSDPNAPAHIPPEW